MSFYNIFADRGIINIIPFFSGLYLAYYESMIILPIFLIINVVMFYLLVNLLARKIIKRNKKYETEKELENDVFDELIKKDYGNINALFSICHWILIFITVMTLYQFKNDFIPFLFFWYLIIGFFYNLSFLFITQFDYIRKAFIPN